MPRRLLESDNVSWTDLQELGASFDVGPIPEDLQDQADEWHEKLVEDAIEVDDEAMEAYLEGNVRLLLFIVTP
jgi:elongation factor G